MLNWSIELKRLDLKYTWAISRNASTYKINAFVSVYDGIYSGIGEAAPNVRYGESPEQFLKEFERFKQEVGTSSFILQELSDFLIKGEYPNALRFAIESAYVHYLAQKDKQTIASILQVPITSVRDTAYTIPIMEVEKLGSYFEEYRPDRFKYIKIKVNSENLGSFVPQVRAYCNNRFIIDANEAYHSAATLLKDLEQCGETNIAFIEQPFPAGEHKAYEFLKNRSPFPVFADESVTDSANFEELAKGFHGINVKLMKAGGYLNGINLLKQAKSYHMSTMIGCMVETGLGISSGLQISGLADFLDLDSFLILKQDPFRWVGEENGKVFLQGAALQA